MHELSRFSPAATMSRHERTVAIDAELIRKKSEDAAANPRKREVHFLHRNTSEPLQRMLNAVQLQSYIRPHRHVQPGKAESVVLLSGALAFATFNDDGSLSLSDSVYLHAGGALAVDCREGVWHTFFAVEPNTVVFEVKAGPHDAATDKEFAPWAPEEGSLEAQAYLALLMKTFLDGKMGA